jgi:hypothetical protein
MSFHSERRVLLRRGPNGFGFHIIGDEREQGIFISSIQSGGAADKSGELRKGDRILSVNNIDLRGASHKDAAAVLKSCGDTANLHVINKSDGLFEILLKFQSNQYILDSVRIDNVNDERPNKMTKDAIGSTGSLKPTTRRQLFVRAEFDYDPARDPSLPGGPGLAFRTGDILNVINATDDSWWQAKRVTNGQNEEEVGIIPSKSRVEKKERARQKRVNFNPGSSSRVSLKIINKLKCFGFKSSTLDRDKKKKKKFGLFNKTGEKKDTQSGEDSENEPESFEPVPSYELVTEHKSKKKSISMNKRIC